MKRTPLIRRTPLRKESRSDAKVIEKYLWVLCRSITRERYGNTCYTCDKTGLEGGNQQTGHMYSKAALGSAMKHDLRILRIQCYRCNINLGGLGAEFKHRMEQEVGKKAMVEIMQDIQDSKNIFSKARDIYLRLIPTYEVILKDLNAQNIAFSSPEFRKYKKLFA